MGKTYLTYNKAINLLCVHFYFYDWHDFDSSYIREKYYRLFNNLPDKIKVKNRKIYSGYLSDKDIEYFTVQLPIYEKKWKCKLNDNDLSIYFSLYHLSNGILTPSKLIERYNKLYSNYNFINEESQKSGLHIFHKMSVFDSEIRHKKELDILSRISKINKLKNMIG
ncbi:MAG: hypothetical protein ACOC3V_02625 [bacterium]